VMCKRCKKMIFLMSFVLVLSLVGNVQAYFDTWTPTGPEREWNSVAMSADGTIQTAASVEGLYVSTDSGDTWAVITGTAPRWNSVAMSADGTIQTATIYGGGGGRIYVSTDTGNTWAAKEATDKSWQSVAMSADGTIQTAGVWGGQIYVSTDTGNTWTAKDANRNWRTIAMSADGTIQTAVVQGGQIYVSTDTGNTWTAKDTNRGWMAAAMSADGTIQTAGVWDGGIYVSTDSGNTWTATGAPNNTWVTVGMSADGRIQTAGAFFDGQICVSTDSGNTWTAKGELSVGCTGIAMSADGCIQTATARHGQIYVCSEDPVELMLNPIPADGSLIPLDTFNNKLQWTLPEPNSPGDEVLCDVHFGTDPNVWDNPKEVDMEAVEEVDITVTADTTYYWAVAIYDPSVDPVLSEAFEFTIILNIAPIVNAGDDVKTWLVDELPIPVDAERVVQLNGIVDDDGHMEPYTVLWTVLSEPDSGTHPAVISSDNIVNPTITMTLPGLYELELAADDGRPIPWLSNSMIHPARMPSIKRDLVGLLLILIAIAKSIYRTLPISHQPGLRSITAPSNEGINE